MGKKDQEQLIQDRKWYVAKSNELIQKSQYSMKLQSQRVLLYMISRIKPRDLPDQVFTFNLAQFCKVAGINIDNGGYYYVTLKEIILELINAKGYIDYQDDRGVIHTKPFSWLSNDKTEIRKGSGEIQIGFSTAVQPYLFDLQSRFCMYRLNEILPLRSKYSIRLYELMRSYAFGKDFDNGEEKEVSYTPDQLRRLLAIEGNHYSQYRDLKQRAILPAIEQINKYSEEIHIRMEEIKHGNKVEQIVFLICFAHGKQVLEAKENKAERLGE